MCNKVILNDIDLYYLIEKEDICSFLLMSGVGLRKCHYFYCEICSSSLCIADDFHLVCVYRFGA